MKLRNEKQLLAVAAELGYEKPAGEDTATFFKYKAKRLYNSKSEFKQFLDVQTDFLPKSIEASQRWHYYINGDRAPHLCPVCDKFIADYKDKFCSHACSTKHKDPNAKKTGPKVDLGQKEKDLRERLKKELPEYKLIKFGHPISAFKHKCGNVIESVNYQLFKKTAGQKKCPCLHKKAVTQNLSNLKASYAARDSVWVPIDYVEGSENATFKHRECKHRVELPWSRNFDMRCPTCFPNKFASNIVTPKMYRQWVKENRPDFKVLDDYVDVGTRLRYKHSCGGITETTPEWFKSKSLRCTNCGPKTPASTFNRVICGTTFNVRGKEAVAIEWILRKTSMKPEDIKVDTGGEVPTIRYREANGGRTQSYFPDLFIEKKNLLVEVKDLNTLGICKEFFYKTGKQLWNTNCAKAKACIDAGYEFRMLVFDSNNNRIKLPKNWHELSHKKILKWFKTRAT